MASLGAIDENVEATQQGGGGGVTILPDDDYELEMIESDVKANSKGTGQNFEFKLQVASGPHKGVWFFGGITNIQHESSQAQTIAQGTLKSLAMACDLPWPLPNADSEVFHYRPFWGRVGSETYFSKKHNKELTKNVVLKYLYEGMPEGDAAPTPPVTKAAPSAAPARPAPTQAATPAGGRAWQKRA